MAAEKLHIAIIGAGWAGLSAAIHLDRCGHNVEVFEAGPTAGGRARTIYSRRLQKTLDNGQHILLGAYKNAISVINGLHASSGARLSQQTTPHTVLHQSNSHEPLLRLPLQLRTADNRRLINTWTLPAPLHLLAGLLTARGYSLKERLNLVRTFQRLKAANWHIPGNLTVKQWLLNERQLPQTIRLLWEPICLAALNTPIEQACAQVYATVLRDSLGSQRQHSDLLIPRYDLGKLLPCRIPASVRLHTGTPVRHLVIEQSRVGIAGRLFDGAIIACGTSSTQRLLQSVSSTDIPDSGTSIPAGRCEQADPAVLRQLLGQLAAFRYNPIATLTLVLRKTPPWPGSSPMLMLEDNVAQAEFGQWLFDVSQFWHHSDHDHLLTVIISDALRLEGFSRHHIMQGVVRQINRQLGISSPGIQVENYELIIEKRATFACTPGLDRPGNRTPWETLYLAGDWTNTGYPAVLEGAVRSGQTAASMLTAALSRSSPN